MDKSGPQKYYNENEFDLTKSSLRLPAAPIPMRHDPVYRDQTMGLRKEAMKRL